MLSAVLHQLGLSPSPAEVTALLLLWLKHLCFHHLPLCGFHHEQPSRKEHFLANSVSVISINIKRIKTSVINIPTHVLASLIYLNMCSCSVSSFCPRSLN